MVKKAVLIGINYPGTSVELRGCVNDVRRMKRCLIDRFGFSNENITVLIDTDKSCLQPTRKNICDALTKLIDSGKSGDFLVVHYSGHGTRKDPGNVGDATGFDECIIPCDLNLIPGQYVSVHDFDLPRISCRWIKTKLSKRASVGDDEFRDMVAQVKEGCQLTIISDSCHSGGLVEGIKEQIEESQVKPPKLGIVNYLRSIVMNLLATCGTSSSQRNPGGGRDSFITETELENGETVEMKTIYISLDNYISLLEQQTGQTGIKLGNIRPTLVKVFSEDASPKVLSNSMERNGHRGLLSMFLGKLEVDAGGSGAPISIPDKGILLSGCQTNQGSEDVYVTRTGKAYGAFSDAIQTILSSTRKEKKITNKEVVLKAKEILKGQRFSQQPGLYCHYRI